MLCRYYCTRDTCRERSISASVQQLDLKGGGGDDLIAAALCKPALSDSESLAAAREIFQKYDQDKSGEIDAEEFHAMCYDIGMVFEEDNERDLVMNLVDVDGDGEISFREFYQWWRKYKAENTGLPELTAEVKAAIHYFRYYDTDLSGKLDLDEFAKMCTAMGWSEDEMQESMLLLDSNNDGEISFSEFVAWYDDGGMAAQVLQKYDKNKR